mgnify:CR=1 FL=1
MLGPTEQDDEPALSGHGDEPSRIDVRCALSAADGPTKIIGALTDPHSIGAYLEEVLDCPFETVSRVIPDERAGIARTLKELADEQVCCLVVTPGGKSTERSNRHILTTSTRYRLWR